MLNGKNTSASFLKAAGRFLTSPAIVRFCHTMKLPTNYPVVDRLRESDHFKDGDVIVLEGDSGFVRSLLPAL